MSSLIAPSHQAHILQRPSPLLTGCHLQLLLYVSAPGSRLCLHITSSPVARTILQLHSLFVPLPDRLKYTIQYIIEGKSPS